MANFKIGEKVKYTGKGFISFDPNDTEMEVVRKEDAWNYTCLYKGKKILFFNHEISKL